MKIKQISIKKFCLINLFFLCSFAFASPKKVLFLAGKRSHGAGQHEHRAGSLLLAKALNESQLNFDAKVFHIWPDDEAEFDNASAVVIYADAGGRLNQEKLDFLNKKVKEGMGIMFLHYGVHPSKKVGNEYFIPWIGGFFETGYSVNPHWVAEIEPKEKHPVSSGINKPILAHDEFYYNMRFPEKDECADCYPLVKSLLKEENITRYNNLWNKMGDDAIGTKQTLMWCRDSKDQGRGVGFTGGHYHRNWAIDDFRKLVLNSIAWISHVEIPKNGVPSKAITQEELNQNLDSQPRSPLTIPTEEELRQLDPMLRPADPANYHQKNHYKLVNELKKKAQSNKK